MKNILYTGCVENREDPLKLGRCQVRIVGLHTDDKTVLPTEDLPWAYPMQPITSAAMNGIGWSPLGPVPGSWVVLMFHDDDTQMPIMLGSIGGIPQSKAAERIIDKGSNSISSDGGILVDSEGNPVLDSEGNAIKAGDTEKTTNKVDTTAVGSSSEADEMITPKVVTTNDSIYDQPEPGKSIEDVLAEPIKTTPPLKYSQTRASERRQGISALLKYCNEWGFTSKYAQAAILAITGIESGWLLAEEGYNYSRQALLQTFPSVFKGQAGKAAEYARWTGTRKDFFDFIYSPEYRNGLNAGNIKPNDGGLYYGRGYVQITGRAMYDEVDKVLKTKAKNLNLITTPDNVNASADNSAAVTIAFFIVKQNEKILRVAQDDPTFFEAALKVTGGYHGGYDNKRSLYQYFLGEGVVPDSTPRTAANAQKIYTEDEVKNYPKEKRDVLLEDRSSNAQYGFTDPRGKYPLRKFVDEADTNRLSRGAIQDTPVAFKDISRTKGIPTANEADPEWEQPIAPFGGQYPYSKIYETESGHVQTFDDTPGHENIGLYHRKGTFIDVDAHGTQVNKIVGDGYTIIDRNGMINISGRCNIYVGQNANIKVGGACDLEVSGTTNAIFHNQVDIGCSADVNWTIGGDFNFKIDGNVTTTILGDNTLDIGKVDKKHVHGDVFFKTDKNWSMETGIDTELKIGGTYDRKSEGVGKVASSVLHYKATGGNVNMDGTEWRGQQGSAATAGPATVAAILPLTTPPPVMESGHKNTFDILKSPVRPSAQVIVPKNIIDANNAKVQDFYTNPANYYDGNAEAGGVNPERPPQVKMDIKEMPAIGQVEGDIPLFLEKQLMLAKNGYWSETGMRDKRKSNPNILSMWYDIGLSTVANGSDQVPWCAAFMNWTLKQTGYRYAQSARAFDIRDNPAKWGARKVSKPEPGDICVWSYSHVNFVYTVNGNTITLVGGNQGGGRASNNNPTGGLVTISYPGGTSANNGNIVGFYRPSRT